MKLTLVFLQLSLFMIHISFSYIFDDKTLRDPLLLKLGDRGYIHGLIFDPNNPIFAVMVGDLLIINSEIIFIRFEGDNQLSVMDVGLELEGTAIAYSPDGSLFAVGNAQGFVEIYETRDYNLLSSIQVGDGIINSVAINQDGTLLALTLGNPMQEAELANVFRIISLETGDEIVSYADDPNLYGGGVTFNPDTGDAVFAVNNVSSEEKSIWIVEDLNTFIPAIQGHGMAFNYTVLAKDKSIFFTDNEGLYHYTYDDFSSEYQLDSNFNLPAGDINSFSAHPRLDFMALAYRIRTLTPAGVPTEHGEGVVCIYDFASQNHCVDVESSITALAFSPDGTLLASGGADGTVRLWGIPAGED